MLLVYARMMAMECAPYEDLVEVLDVAEYLPMLLLRKDHMTEHFRETLTDTRWPAFHAALQRFDTP